MRIKTSRYPRASQEPVINLTPLIDVVFVVLIMFIVIAPLLPVDRLQLPQAPERPQQQASADRAAAIALQVHSDDSLWMDGKPVRLEDLRQVLQALRAQHPLEVPQLYQDRNAHFGTYQRVKNAFEEAGFQEIDLLLSPEPH